MKKSTPKINHLTALVKTKKAIPDTPEAIGSIADKLVKELNLKVVKKTHFAFSPSGVTLVYILSQSHLVIHT